MEQEKFIMQQIFYPLTCFYHQNPKHCHTAPIPSDCFKHTVTKQCLYCLKTSLQGSSYMSVTHDETYVMCHLLFWRLSGLCGEAYECLRPVTVTGLYRIINIV